MAGPYLNPYAPQVRRFRADVPGQRADRRDLLTLDRR